jgi:hypothetical protein
LKHILPFILALLCFILPAIAGDDGGLVNFRTPSDNIHCLVSSDEGSIDCEIITVTVQSPLPERPADCDLEWGKRFYMKEKGQAELICTGDTVRDHKAKIVPYGENFAFGLFTCVSAEKGLSCYNNDGHGFFLSKGKQTLF